MTSNTENGTENLHTYRERNNNRIKTALLLIVISIFLLDWVSRG